MQLLIDYGTLNSVQVVSESSQDGLMTIRGIFGRANEFNNNNRRYPKSILEREVNKLQPLIQEKRLLGECEHPDRSNVSLMNASHLITKLSWQGDVLIGEAKLLNTPNGKVAQQLIKDGVKIGVSSRGLGTLKECKEFPGKFEVNEDFRAVTFDLVADPSTNGAFPGLVTESTQKVLERTKKEVAAQNLMLKLFEAKMQEVKSNTVKKLFEGEQRNKRLSKASSKATVKFLKTNDPKHAYKSSDLGSLARQGEKKVQTKKAVKGKIPYQASKSLKNKGVEAADNNDSPASSKVLRYQKWVKKGHRKAFRWDKEYHVKEAIESALKKKVNEGMNRLERLSKIANKRLKKNDTSASEDYIRKSSAWLTKNALKRPQHKQHREYRADVQDGKRKHYSALDYFKPKEKDSKNKGRRSTDRK